MHLLTTLYTTSACNPAITNRMIIEVTVFTQTVISYKLQSLHSIECSKTLTKINWMITVSTIMTWKLLLHWSSLSLIRSTTTISIESTISTIIVLIITTTILSYSIRSHSFPCTSRDSISITITITIARRFPTTITIIVALSKHKQARFSIDRIGSQRGL